MEDAKAVANGSFVPVMENGLEGNSESDSEGDGLGDSASMPKDSGERHQMSQEQVQIWRASHSISQLHSESQTGPKSAAADSRASGFERSSTQAEPRGKGHACEPSSPFPDRGKAAGSCESTIQPQAKQSEGWAAQISDDGCDAPRRGSPGSLTPVRRNPYRNGRAGGSDTVARSGSKEALASLSPASAPPVPRSRRAGSMAVKGTGWLKGRAAATALRGVVP
jgi:hypothetical protein